MSSRAAQSDDRQAAFVFLLRQAGQRSVPQHIAHGLVALTHAGGPGKAGNETASSEFSTEHASMERLDDDFPDFHLSLGAASHIAEQLPRDAVMTFLTAGTPITDAGTIITGTVIVIGIDQARRIVPANHLKLPELLRKPNSANKFVQ